MNSLFDIEVLDDLARKDSLIHSLHPVSVMAVTLAFIITVTSVGRYDIGRLLPFIIYPVVIFTLAEIPAAVIVKRVLILSPLIVGIGVAGVFTDSSDMLVYGFAITGGWAVFITVLIKYILTSVTALSLIAVTGIDRLTAAMRMIRIPAIFVLQLLLTYRYISLLRAETARMLTAYSLRAPMQKGIRADVWGPFIGQLVIRAYERALWIYRAMCIRGFMGEFQTGSFAVFSIRDFAFLSAWFAFFTVARIYDIPAYLGSLLIGVID